MVNEESLQTKIRSFLEQEGDDLKDRLQESLKSIAETFGAATCTFHQTHAQEPLLELRGYVGLPEKLAAITQTIPFGKGMAGICAERREPVTTCNLQQDSAGVARPRARETGVGGAIVVPLLRGDHVAGTLGVGKTTDYDYSPEETQLLEGCGQILLDACYQQ